MITDTRTMVVRRDTGALMTFRKKMMQELGMVAQFTYISSVGQHVKYKYWLSSVSDIKDELISVKRDCGREVGLFAYMSKVTGYKALFSTVGSSENRDLLKVTYFAPQGVA